MRYGIRQIEAPPVDPVTLAEAKDHCEIPAVETQHDAKVTRFIKAATQAAERHMSRRIIRQIVELALDCWPVDGVIDLPEGELVSVVSVKYFDASGLEQTWSSDEYQVDNYANPPRLAPAPTFSFPAHRSVLAPIKIRYAVGYAPGSGSPTDYRENVPEPIRQAILLMVGTWFENREDTIVGTISSQLQLGVDRLLDPYRIWGG